MITNIQLTNTSIDVALFVSGITTGRNRLYSPQAFEDESYMERTVYSVFDEHEKKNSKANEEGFGLMLQAFLDDAYCQDMPEEIHLKSIDGYESSVTELMSPRFFIPGLAAGDDSIKERVGIMLSFYKNGERVKAYPHPTIMFGQQGINDKNKDYFTKGLCSLVMESRERAFYVKGSGVKCNRFFGIDQIFNLTESRSWKAELFRVKDDEGHYREVPGAFLGNEFFKENVDMTEDADTCYIVSASERVAVDKSRIYVFFMDENLKRIAAWDGDHLIEDMKGIILGQEVVQTKNDVDRIPSSDPDQSDFYIHIIDENKEEKYYYYSFNEFMDSYSDLITDLTIEYYNHNLANKKGGIRQVTGRGIPIKDLLVGLPEISGVDMIEDGGIFFKVHTNDTYKEKMAVEGSELTAFSFTLCYEHDQRSATGMEKGDTSAWDDSEKHFVPVKGSTPYRIYCNKNNASPAVYKNACGMTIIL